MFTPTMEAACHDINSSPPSDFNFAGLYLENIENSLFDFDSNLGFLDPATFSINQILASSDSIPYSSLMGLSPDPPTPNDKEKDSKDQIRDFSISSSVENKGKPQPVEISKTRSKNTRSLSRTIPLSYACPECMISYTSLRALGQHSQVTHSMKAFKCKHCPYRSARHDNLRNHERSCKAYRHCSSIAKPVKAKENLSTLGKSDKRQRVNFLNLPNVNTKPTLPAPFSTGPNKTVVTGPTSNLGHGTNSGSTTNRCKSAMETLTIPFPDLQPDRSPSGPNPSVPSVDYSLEIAELRKRLEEAEEEVRLWKRTYFDLRGYSRQDSPD
ncbi:hypothetical protein TWF506_001849 [Arthrobotrys conoides]|uniref:C2H2-type domain-containing protein n=1 Tax=Arthrobotrys conoides TaxID=74498 RepID=A0AAN8RYG1_9PEZI